MSKLSRVKLSRIIVIVVVLTVFTLVLSSCTQPTSKTPDDSTQHTEIPDTNKPSEGSAKEEDPFYIDGSEDVTLTYWMPMNEYQSQYYTTMGEHPFYQWLEERTGVKVEFIHPSYEQKEQQMTLMISSGDFYDILGDPNYPGGPQAGIDEGCFVDLKPYLDEYMPNYKKALFDEENEFNHWEWSDEERSIFAPQPQTPAFAYPMHTFEGQIWGVSQIWRDELPAEAGPVIRNDWLKELNLTMPETIDELETVLKAFKEKGIPAPMSLGSLGYYDVFQGGILLSAFDTGGYFCLDRDGKTIEEHSFIKDEFREYLELMRDWYAAGYIDPDFMNTDYDTLWSKMLNDELGIWLCTWSTPEDIEMAYTGDQDFDIQAMPLPRKSKDQILRSKMTYATEPTMNLALTTSCEHQEIAAQWLDKHFEKEAVLRQSYGVEGVHYEWVDGVPLFKESFFEDENMPSEVKRSVELYTIGPFYYSNRSAILLQQRGDNAKLGRAMEAYQIWGENAELQMRIPYTVFEGDDFGKQQGYMVEVETYAQPMVIKFIIGDESIDEKWDEFVQTCIDLGINQARDIWQASYDKMGNNTK